MKLALKTALAMMIGILAVLAVDGYLRVQRQLSLFGTDMRRDHEAMGRVVASVMAEVWLTEGEFLAVEIIDRVNARMPRIQLKWIRLEEFRGAGLDDPGLRAALSAVVEGREYFFSAEDGQGERYLHSFVPVRVANFLAGAIEITESMKPQAEFVRTTILRAVATTAILLLVSTTIIFVTGFVFVGRPITKLMDLSRRIGAGDFAGHAILVQRDEISDLAREMNSMADDLAAAQRRIAEETAARLVTLDQLRHADRLKTVGQLTAGIVHDIGTPLTIVSGRAQEVFSGEVVGDEIADNARIIIEQTERITTIVRQILRFARRGQQERLIDDLGVLARDTLRLLGPMALKRGVTLVWDGNEVPAPVSIDRGQIQQTLANLLINAIQATDHGGRVTMGIDRFDGPAPGGDDAGSGPFWSVFVRDDGAGIPDEALPHIFEPFFTTKGTGEGTGLGLSIAREIVRDHGGWISVTSRPGAGTGFTISLPAAKGAE